MKQKRVRLAAISYVMVFAMIMSLIVVPKKNVQAEERTPITVNAADNQSNDVYVVLEKVKDIPAKSNEDGNWPEQDISEYQLHIVNNKSTDISDWKVTIQLANTPYWGYGYNGAELSDNVISFATYSGTNESGETWDNMTVQAGEEKNTGAGFAIPEAALAGAVYTLTYYDGASSGSAGSGDSGSSGGDSGFDGSNIGTIDASTNYNFAKLLQLSLYFYDANMCGDQVSETSLYSSELGGWRGDCHVNDYFTYNGKQYKAAGGFHDAGDHVKFGMPANEAFITLGISYLEFGQAYDELGQKEHLKKIVDYYCTYLKSCTVLDSTDTTAEAFCYQIGCGQKDHESWVAPEVEDQSKTNRTYSLVATSSNPATEYVAGAAAALAINYLNFGNEEDLKYAKALFAMAKKNGKQTGATDTSGSFYASGTWEDEYCLAAAMLYKITNDSTYASDYNSNNKNASNLQKPNGWCDLYQFASYYAPSKSSSELNTIQNWLSSQAGSSMSSYYAGNDYWGTARINCNVQFSALLYDKLNGVDTYANWAKYQMSTILGNNSRKINLVCGYNNASPTKPHHRAASGYSGWDGGFNSNAAQKYTLYGALVGGPTSSDFSTYKDAVNDAVSNEVTLDYNAGMVGAAAALYLLNKDSTEEGFTEQTILPDFFGGSNAPQRPSAYTGGSSGGDTPSEGEVAIESVTLSKKSASLSGTGKKAAATITVTPAKADKSKLSVSSDDEDVATATIKDSTLNIVSGSKSGTAVITVASTENPEIKATCQVKVVHPVESFTLDKDTVSLSVGGTEKIAVATVTPDPADDYKVKWSVDKADVISLDETIGSSVSITGLKTGSAVVTATIGTLTKKVAVTVGKAAQETPAVSYNVTSQTSSQIKVKAETQSTGTLELSVDQKTWVQGTNDVYTFDGLKDGTDYTIYARLAETEDASVSEISPDTITTFTLFSSDKIKDADGNYLIDISKITGVDCDYLKKMAERIENGSADTNFDVVMDNEKITIVTKDGKHYVISGENTNVSFIINDGCDTILSDVVLSDVTVSGSATISVKSKNEIKNGITLDNDSSLVIAEGSADGAVTISGGSDAAVSGNGKLTINGGNITVISDSDDGIYASDFEITGGNLSVSANGTGITASDVSIGGADTVVRVNSGGAAISGTNIDISGGDVSLEVTETDASVVEAAGDITLRGGTVETTRPSGNTGFDYSVGESEDGKTGTITIGNDVSIAGNPEYSVPPVDDQGEQIFLSNITIYNGEDSIVIQSKKNVTCNLTEIAKVKEWVKANPYKTAVFYKDDTELKDGKFEVDGDAIEIHIKWVAKTYTITYECNGGKFTSDDYKTTYTVDDGNYKLPDNITRTNYVFYGWFLDQEMKKPVDAVSVETNGNVTVYAKWVIDKPEKPVIASVTNVNAGVSVKWNRVDGVNYYILQRKENNSSWTQIAKIEDVTATAYTDKTVTNGKNYSYRICGYGCSQGEYSSASASLLHIAAPKITRLSNISNGVTVNWNEVSGVTGYQIYRSTNGNGYKKIASVKGASVVSYKDTKATGKGAKYQYRVYAYKTVGSSVCKSGTSNTRTIYHLAAVAAPNTYIIASGVKLTWNTTSGATGYYVYRSVNGKAYGKIATVKGKTYLDQKVYNGSKYQYKIVAYKTVSNVTYRGAYSKDTVTGYIVAPRINSLTNYAAKTMTVKWSKNSAASGYMLQYSTSANFSKAATVTVKPNSVVTRKITGLTKGKTYYVRVKGYKIMNGKKYYSPWSATKNIKIKK